MCMCVCVCVCVSVCVCVCVCELSVCVASGTFGELFIIIVQVTRFVLEFCRFIYID